MKTRFSPTGGSQAFSPSSPPSSPKSTSPKSSTPRAVPQNEDRFESAPARRPAAPTVQQLTEGKANLKRTDYGTVHPDLPGIRTRRGDQEPAHQFVDLTTDARASTHRLMSEPDGRRMLTELNGRTGAVNPGAVGTPEKPLTVADIRSGRDAQMKMAHSPRHDGTYASMQQAYRYDGKPSAGQASNITYDETAKSSLRFNSLGHEGVHAWRASNGLGVSPPEISPGRYKHASTLDIQGGDKTVKDYVSHHAHMQEEFETVGLRPTPHSPNQDGWAPSENKIRQEHGLPQRNDYSGETPAKTDALLKPVDEGTDDRSWYQKTFTSKPSPVGAVVNHLEG